MDQRTVESQEPAKPATAWDIVLAGAIVVFILAWVITHIVAMVYSVSCATSSGHPIEKVLGVGVAWFFGPFFFLYKSITPGYCRA